MMDYIKLNRKVFFGSTLILLLLFLSCRQDQERDIKVASQNIVKENVSEIITGAERISLYHEAIKGKKVACVVNHTSRVGEMHLVDTLLKLEINVVKVFAPEHGFRGDVPDGEKIEDNIDPESGVPIISLYGNKRKPNPQDLQGIEVVLFDIQDVGARFYTYLSTMHNIMEACAENNVKCIILDRPNPNGHYIDGPVLEPDQRTFVGMHPVPIVYGMTIGEYAGMINGEGWLKDSIKCSLEIIELKNYAHDSYYEVPIPPSPNLPNQRSIYLYPSLCFFEGTHVSIGRGTDKQFQVIGHPKLKDSNYTFTPVPNKGSKYPKHKGVECYGEDLTRLTLGSLRDAGQINLEWLITYYNKVVNANEPFFIESGHFDRIAGTKKLKDQLANGLSSDEIRSSWQESLELFKATRAKYLIYP